MLYVVTCSPWSRALCDHVFSEARVLQEEQTSNTRRKLVIVSTANPAAFLGSKASTKEEALLTP